MSYDSTINQILDNILLQEAYNIDDDTLEDAVNFVEEMTGRGNAAKIGQIKYENVNRDILKTYLSKDMHMLYEYDFLRARGEADQYMLNRRSYRALEEQAKLAACALLYKNQEGLGSFNDLFSYFKAKNGGDSEKAQKAVARLPKLIKTYLANS